MSDSTNEEVTTDKNVTGELPEWAREQITKANNEAAKYRVEKNEAVEAAKKEVTDSFTEKIAELEAQIEAEKLETNGSRTEVAKLKAAINAGITADKVETFAGLLKGETEDELRSHAEELKSLFTTDEQPKSVKATDPSQGQGASSATPLNGDKLLTDILKIVNKR